MLPGDLSEAQEFAQSKGQAQKQGRTGVRFADVAGCSSVLAELKDVVEVRPSAGLFVCKAHYAKDSSSPGPCMGSHDPDCLVLVRVHSLWPGQPDITLLCSTSATPSASQRLEHGLPRGYCWRASLEQVSNGCFGPSCCCHACDSGQGQCWVLNTFM